LGNLDDDMDIDGAWGAKASLDYYELKKHKPWFNKGCSTFLGQRKQFKFSNYRIQGK
jgi:hypothetical protein